MSQARNNHATNYTPLRHHHGPITSPSRHKWRWHVIIASFLFYHHHADITWQPWHHYITTTTPSRHNTITSASRHDYLTSKTTWQRCRSAALTAQTSIFQHASLLSLPKLKSLPISSVMKQSMVHSHVSCPYHTVMKTRLSYMVTKLRLFNIPFRAMVLESQLFHTKPWAHHLQKTN